ncbi:amidohydrolase 2 [Fragilariopsis cylindrus CCMP1102]|uniref:Amidohydrolase 2 n=1 Tax=Fragilariopsis cylindrus CCMP1102 TaxID=635003 RepID=A0A1E7EX36_9STRA|nr:amidohydrolase 2 [Fragilariopsis cylindrus CCMP1102]|eukprot:OEU10416.1 amidohydrolase 2 [Fragilariopsis cylindrus CCMP1102]
MSTKATPSSSSSSSQRSAGSSAYNIIDSHLHVWANEIESKQYKYEDGQTPPESLKNNANVLSLITKMKESNVDGALIVQPINHKYDHSYVLEEAMKKYPNKFKGMLLHDPLLSSKDAVIRLEELALQGFVGVRYNPYLWPLLEENNNIDGAITSSSSKNNMLMSTPNGSGLAVYKRCGELNMPVGIMCFKGLDLHINDIRSLLESSSKTMMILDHFSFTSLSTTNDVFQQLLQLGKDYPNQLIIKISALFRLGDRNGYPYTRLQKERFEPLLEVFGSDRLMFGSDFPFVLEQQESYSGTIDLISNVWLKDYPETVKTAIMGGTAERLFGKWG